MKVEHDARKLASSEQCPTFDEAGWVGAEAAPTTRRVGTSVPAIMKSDGDQIGSVGNRPNVCDRVEITQ